MQVIDISNLSKILPLYEDWEHHMCLRAAGEGKATAEVWADSVDSPRSAAVCFGVRLLIGGNPQDQVCRSEITVFLHNIVLKNQIERMRHFFMVFWHEEDWQEVLLDALSRYNPALREREYYRLDISCNLLNPQLPQGYELRFVDSAFLDECEWKNKRTLLYEMCSERANIDDFHKHSFGVCAVCRDEIAGWCLSEYNNSSGCEVGIEVVEAHQRKGIGTALTLALAAEAKKQGLQYIGWSCFKDNLPSVATARKTRLSKIEDCKVIIVQR